MDGDEVRTNKADGSGKTVDTSARAETPGPIYSLPTRQQLLEGIRTSVNRVRANFKLVLIGLFTVSYVPPISI